MSGALIIYYDVLVNAVTKDRGIDGCRSATKENAARGNEVRSLHPEVSSMNTLSEATT